MKENATACGICERGKSGGEGGGVCSPEKRDVGIVR